MSEKPETFSPEEWSVIESALFRYQRRIEDQMAEENRTESPLLDLIKRTDRKVSRLRDSAHSGIIEATPVKQEAATDPTKRTGRWGQGGPGSDDFFSFAD